MGTRESADREQRRRRMLENYRIRTDLALEATERFTEENVEIRGG